MRTQAQAWDDETQLSQLMVQLHNDYLDECGEAGGGFEGFLKYTENYCHAHPEAAAVVLDDHAVKQRKMHMRLVR